MSETSNRAASSTRRTPPRATRAAAPFSPTAAKLIKQIQAEARAALLEELSAKDGVIVLHWSDAQDRRLQCHGDHISIRDERGSSIELYRNRLEPASWVGQPHMAGYWHPAYWLGDQTMVDASGVKWRREFERMVCDDFGYLVEVPA